MAAMMAMEARILMEFVDFKRGFVWWWRVGWWLVVGEIEY